MPLYEYVCSDCRETFTLLQTVHVKPEETVCPQCGKDHVQKRFSTFASKVEGRNVPSGGGSHSCPPTGCGCA
jgi:putative FmdB family regulatory protein